MKSTPFSKEALWLVMFKWNFQIKTLGNVSNKLSIQQYFLISLINMKQRNINLYPYVICNLVSCFMITFHFVLIPASWNLICCSFWKPFNFQEILTSYETVTYTFCPNKFTLLNTFSKGFLFVRVPANHRHIIC